MKIGSRLFSICALGFSTIAATVAHADIVRKKPQFQATSLFPEPPLPQGLSDENAGVDEIEESEFPLESLLDAHEMEDASSLTAEIEAEILESFAAVPPSPAESTVKGIPLVHNEKVQSWIQYFSVRDRARFQRFLNRGKSYRALVEDVLSKHQMPRELYYLALIESGYVVHAHSHASAVGIWQFIRATGVRYGLQNTPFVDERRDPIRASHAASRYLKDLHSLFGSWYLAMAAYNCGERRVMRAIVKGGTRDFWKLSELKLLPPETREYVPKFLAALTIGENIQKYGFEPPEADPFPSVDAVEVPTPVHLQDVSQMTGIAFDELKRLNPHLRSEVTPPHVKSYRVWVPIEKLSAVQSIAADLPLTPLEKLSIPSGKTKLAAARSQSNRSKTAALARRSKLEKASGKAMAAVSRDSGKKVKQAGKTVKVARKSGNVSRSRQGVSVRKNAVVSVRKASRVVSRERLGKGAAVSAQSKLWKLDSRSSKKKGSSARRRQR